MTTLLGGSVEGGGRRIAEGSGALIIRAERIVELADILEGRAEAFVHHGTEVLFHCWAGAGDQKAEGIVVNTDALKAC